MVKTTTTIKNNYIYICVYLLEIYHGKKEEEKCRGEKNGC